MNNWVQFQQFPNARAAWADGDSLIDPPPTGQSCQPWLSCAVSEQPLGAGARPHTPHRHFHALDILKGSGVP